jgi:hypothetical protein
MAASINNAGSVVLFAGKEVPREFLLCDGRELPCNDYTLLRAMREIQSTWDKLWLPKLEPVSGIPYIVRTDGIFEGSHLSYEINFEEEDRMIGVVAPLKGDTIPQGWLLCDGRKLENGEAEMLKAVIGEKYRPNDDDWLYIPKFYLPKTDTPHVICAEGAFPQYDGGYYR